MRTHSKRSVRFSEKKNCSNQVPSHPEGRRNIWYLKGKHDNDDIKKNICEGTLMKESP